MKTDRAAQHRARLGYGRRWRPRTIEEVREHYARPWRRLARIALDVNVGGVTDEDLAELKRRAQVIWPVPEPMTVRERIHLPGADR